MRNGTVNDVFAVPEPSVVTDGSHVSWNFVVTSRLPRGWKLKLDSTKVALKLTVSPRLTRIGFRVVIPQVGSLQTQRSLT